MKRKLLTLIFVALMAPLASFSQQDDKAVLLETLLLNNGISGSQFVPVWGDEVGNLVQSQFILPRESLTDLSYGEIRKLTFYTRNGYNMSYISWGSNVRFEVYLAEVSFTDFNEESFYDWENMTLVYSGSLVVSSYKMVVTIPKSRYFTYEGRDLMVGIKQVVAGTSKNVNFLGVAQTGNTALHASGSGSVVYGDSFLPKTLITYQPGSAPSCVGPLDLNLVGCEATYAEIGWEDDGHTAWQLVYSTDATFNPDEATPIDITERPYTLSGLSPETEYHVCVRANCGNDNYSSWSEKLSFTTTVSCVTPSNLQLVSQSGISAVIGWTGHGSDNYSLRYKDNTDIEGEILLSCDFENGLPSGWTVIDHDGDGRSWSLDNGGYTPFEGNNCMYSASYANYQYLQADDWLITPSVELGGTATFYVKGRLHYSIPCTEHFAVYLSTTNTNVGSFTQISPEFVTTGDYVLYSVDLSSYQGSGYIAIRHFNSVHTSGISVDNVTVYSEPPTWIEIENIPSSSYTLDGLSERTYYEAQVRAVCSAQDVSEWSESLFFNTTADCSNYVVDVEHPFFEGFESTVFPPSCWSAPANYNQFSWEQFASPADVGDPYHICYHKGMCSANSGLYGPVELEMPEVQIVGSHATLSFWSYCDIYEGGGQNYVLISTNHGNTFSQLWVSSPGGQTWNNTTISLDNYVNQSVIIKFRLVSNPSHKWYLDDVAITVPYDKEFVTAGNWNEASNWSPQGVPTSSQSVLINKAATIPSGCIAEARVVKIGNGSLIIADGGQLKHNNTGVNAHVKKSITGYSNGPGNWYMIATPVERSHYPTNVTNLIPTGNTNYDLYRFDQNLGVEWRNYKEGEIRYINNTEGYLYAKKTATNLEFVGELVPSQTPVTVALECRPDHPEYDSRGWNLIGNPFACDAYLQGNPNFYRMNANGTGFILANDAISPCEGIFVKATEPGQDVTFTRAGRGGESQMDFNLSDANGQMIDRARIHLNSTQTTDKFSLFANSTKLYIPNEGNEYAAVGAESSGEIPVNFKSYEDGNYCISVDCDVNMSYLHLIDNLTGADIDLRKTPTYSFTSKTSDYASRFKVVFMTESDGNGDSFLFVNNGKLIVLGSDNEATLQIIDMTGRILSSERISGSCAKPLNYAPGIYVVRLIEGNEVRTQKVVLGRN